MSNDKLTFDQIRKKISKNVKCFQWTRGRQIGEYLIMPIIRTKKLPFDLYIIKYPKGSYIPEHTDPVKKGFEHHRINFVFKKAHSGGEYKGTFEWKFWRFMKLRPDINKHSVTEILSGTRYVLSLGWMKKTKII